MQVLYDMGSGDDSRVMMLSIVLHVAHRIEGLLELIERDAESMEDVMKFDIRWIAYVSTWLW
jgi:hypothetical protein